MAKGLFSSRLTVAAMVLSVPFSSAASVFEDYAKEQIIMNAKTSISVTNEFMKYTDDMLSEAGCSDLKFYRRELAEKQRQNTANLRILFDNNEIKTFGFVWMRYQSDTRFLSAFKKIDKMEKSCGTDNGVGGKPDAVMFSFE